MIPFKFLYDDRFRLPTLPSYPLLFSSLLFSCLLFSPPLPSPLLSCPVLSSSLLFSPLLFSSLPSSLRLISLPPFISSSHAPLCLVASSTSPHLYLSFSLSLSVTLSSLSSPLPSYLCLLSQVILSPLLHLSISPHLSTSLSPSLSYPLSPSNPSFLGPPGCAVKIRRIAITPLEVDVDLSAKINEHKIATYTYSKSPCYNNPEDVGRVIFLRFFVHVRRRSAGCGLLVL